jgi:hypothetical protein
MLVEVVVWVKQLFSQTGAGPQPLPFKASNSDFELARFAAVAGAHGLA